MAEAIVAETSYDTASLERNVRRAGLLAIGVTIPAVILGVVLAPWLASVYGPSYQENSTGLIQILFPAAIPSAILQLFIFRLRSLGRMRWVIASEAAIAVLVLVFALILAPQFGIVGVAWAWLGAFSVAALLALAVYFSGHAPGPRADVDTSDAEQTVGVA